MGLTVGQRHGRENGATDVDRGTHEAVEDRAVFERELKQTRDVIRIRVVIIEHLAVDLHADGARNPVPRLVHGSGVERSTVDGTLSVVCLDARTQDLNTRRPARLGLKPTGTLDIVRLSVHGQRLYVGEPCVHAAAHRARTRGVKRSTLRKLNREHRQAFQFLRRGSRIRFSRSRRLLV